MTTKTETQVERTPYGERVHKARRQKKLSQRALADLVGISQSTLAELEKSANGSSRSYQIAKVTGVRVEWLVEGTGPMIDGSLEPSGRARTVASEKVAHQLVGKPQANDYRTVAQSLAASLEESGVQVTVPQFMKLLEATYEKLRQ